MVLERFRERDTAMGLALDVLVRTPVVLLKGVGRETCRSSGCSAPNRLTSTCCTLLEPYLSAVVKWGISFRCAGWGNCCRVTLTKLVVLLQAWDVACVEKPGDAELLRHLALAFLSIEAYEKFREVSARCS